MKMMSDGSIPEHHPHCLGCGSENPAGMHLRTRLDGEVVRGEVTFDRRQQGAPGIAHGGAVATVLDDALGSVLVVLETPAVTANLNVSFRAPTLLHQPLHVEARVVERDGRKLHLSARLMDEQDTTLAEATALFLAVDVVHFTQGGEVLPEAWSTWGSTTT
ncbi:PaaI family thioesterase [Patulibacter defluvii]|uniref:PaaI family thioesterase n=1 Tax=Patulibacter defluvii TaxID=3095358 RepID=UPI002A74ABFB|nr:PaaI family thioesterase [Patulibacter sp. DM4]